ncbi:MAG: ferrochelatase [Pseudomonadota bacterium]|nr:ferrochelatase [Pseudomonadota bacterium]
MPHYIPEPAFSHGSPRRIGILLVNLGTPDAPDAPALRRYLGQFLWDPRVVEIPRPLWWLILNGIILNTRPAKSAAKYAKIWMGQDGSPLRHWTARQAAGLAQALGNDGGEPVEVAWGMRYGQPSIEAALLDLRARGCDRVLFMPMYPQYAASTTASSTDAVAATFRRLRNVPGLRTVRHFHDHPAYIGALAARVRAHWAVHGRPDRLVMSFHGVPRYTLDKGDPYHCECHKTGRLLAEALQLDAGDYVVAFQSLFGRAEWIKPYTEPTVRELARAGVARIDVVCPGFPADCLETLEEIGMEVRDAFLAEGGKTYHYIAALNDDLVWIDALARIARENLAGWRKPDWTPEAEHAAGEQSLMAARHHGAER